MTLLPTAVVKLVTPNATLPVRVLVDSGSDQSYIRGEIVEALGLDSGGSAKTMTILMHGGQSRTTRVKKANFQMSTRGRKTNVTLNAWAAPRSVHHQNLRSSAGTILSTTKPDSNGKNGKRNLNI